jgi:hypothetical protein
MIRIAHEAETAPDTVRAAPVTTPVGRLDQTLAARQPNLRWTPGAGRAAGPASSPAGSPPAGPEAARP